MPSVIPSTQLVEKKAMFLVSSGFSLEKSGVRVWGSDSPVREELSTWEMKHMTVIDGKNKNGKIRLSCWEEKQTFSSNIKKLSSVQLLRGVDGRFGSHGTLDPLWRNS